MGRIGLALRLVPMSKETSAQALPQSPESLRGLEELVALATLSFLCLLGAAAAGVVLGLCLRRRGYTASWAALALSPMPLWLVLTELGWLGATPAAISLACLIGFPLGAIGWGAHVALEDRRAGGDRATAARRLRSPLNSLRACLRHRRESTTASGEGVPLGRDPRGQLICVGRGSASSGSHVLIPGATGAGKTTSLAALLVDYVARSGFGAVVLEAKSDRVLLESAEAAAANRGRRFHLLSPIGPASYDPLAQGSVDERSERLIAVENWGSSDAAFYRQAASPFLRLVIRTLDRAGRRSTLAAVADHCEPDELENLALTAEDSDGAEEVGTTVRALRADQRRAIAGLQARLQNLASSDFARRWLEPERAQGQCFDLREVIARREVAYLRFDTDRTGNVGRAIAQMALLDLGAAASALMGQGVGTFVAIDEFGALEAPALDRLFARGRAAGFSVALGTQTLADLRAAGPAVRERIGATVSSVICHRIGEQADAEWVAELVGAVPTWQSTVRTNGLGLPTTEGTRTRGYRFEVNPSELQRLSRGHAFIARLDASSTERANEAHVVPPWLRLAGQPPCAPARHQSPSRSRGRKRFWPQARKEKSR